MSNMMAGLKLLKLGTRTCDLKSGLRLITPRSCRSNHNFPFGKIAKHKWNLWSFSNCQPTSSFSFPVVNCNPFCPIALMIQVVRLKFHVKIALFMGSRGTSGGISPRERCCTNVLINSSWYHMTSLNANLDFPVGNPSRRTLVAIVRSIDKTGRCKIAWMFVMARSKLKTCLEKPISVVVARPVCETIMKLHASSYQLTPIVRVVRYRPLQCLKPS